MLLYAGRQRCGMGFHLNGGILESHYHGAWKGAYCFFFSGMKVDDVMSLMSTIWSVCI